MFTINPEFRRVSDRTSRVSSPASVLPDVGEVHTGDDQQAGPRPHHGGADARAGVELLSLEAPGDGDRHVASGYDTGQLAKLPGVYHFSSK